MQVTDIPDKFPIPFADSATDPTYRRAIPEASQIGIENGAASLTDGFPPLTFTPVNAGGTPPFGQDMNGILYQITQWNQWQAAGGPVFFDSAFASDIGGYPEGAVLASAVYDGLMWRSTADNNTTDPDAPATSANWVVHTRARLTADTNFYVSASAGNDNNTGLTTGSRWATIQYAASFIQENFDLAGHVATINVADGTYSLSGSICSISGGFVGATGPESVVILGNVATPTSVIINSGTTNAIIGLYGAKFTIKGAQITAADVGIVGTGPGTAIVFSDIAFGTCTNAQVQANLSALVAQGGDYSIIGNSQYHAIAASAGSIILSSDTITISGATWGTAGFAADGVGFLIAGAGLTFSGSATGKRYSASLNGVINSNGVTFPGTVAGTTATGGQYA